jgi:hypothetical protein
MKILSSPHSIIHWTTFAGLISIAIFLRVVGFQGYVDSDPRGYAILANDLARGILHIPAHDDWTAVFPLRFGVYGPTAILIKAFSLSELTLAAYPFLVSIVGCLLAYIVARWLFSPLAGLISIAILAVLPVDVSMASILFPDAIAAFWANVGVALVYLGLTRDRMYESAAYATLGGICFGVSWLSKEAVVYLAPFVGICILHLHGQVPLRARVASLFYVGFGSLLVLSAEVLFYQAFTGDPLFHFHELERNYEQNYVWFFRQSSPYFGWESGAYVKALVSRLFIAGPADLLTSFSIIPAFAVFALVWGAAFRDRSFTMPGVWFVTLLLLFNFASSSFKRYLPLPLVEDRYLYSLLFPAVLLVSGFFATLLAPSTESSVRMVRRIWPWAVISVCFVISVCGLPEILTSRPEHVARLVATKVTATDTVYTDYRTARSLVFFRTGLLRPSTSTTIPYENLSLEDLTIGTYVLVDQKKIDFLKKSYKYHPPGFASAPPETWRKIWNDRSASLFYIERTNGAQNAQGRAAMSTP